MHKLLLLSLCLLISSGAFSQTLKTFTPGEAAKASEVNGNFNLLLERISQLENDGNTLASCNTYESTASGIVECPQGSTMTGGGFAFADPSGSVSASRPLNNGWQCLWDDGSIDPALGTSTCHVRCCGAPAPDLGLGQYCSSNYCIQGQYKNVAEHVWYILTLEQGTYRQFPMDVDATFTFPPENIGGMSWWLEYEGQEYHVTNLDEACINSGEFWGNCMGPWSNSNILQQAMLSGNIKIKPGPFNVLNEIQIVNTVGAVIRFQSSIDTGNVATEAAFTTTGYSVYRPTPGTGNYGATSDCSELGLPFLTTLDGQFNREYANVNVAVRQTKQIIPPSAYTDYDRVLLTAYRLVICSNTPPGVHDIPYVAIDGVGNKHFVGEIEVKILDEFRSVGEVVAD